MSLALYPSRVRSNEVLGRSRMPLDGRPNARCGFSSCARLRQRAIAAVACRVNASLRRRAVLYVVGVNDRVICDLWFILRVARPIPNWAQDNSKVTLYLACVPKSPGRYDCFAWVHGDRHCGLTIELSGAHADV